MEEMETEASREAVEAAAEVVVDVVEAVFAQLDGDAEAKIVRPVMTPVAAASPGGREGTSGFTKDDEDDGDDDDDDFELV